MDLLKKENGETLIEVMVAIVIIGLITGFTLIFFTNIFENPRLLKKDDALFYANQEINYAVKNRQTRDTVYFSPDSSMLIERKIVKDKNIYNINVNVKLKNSDKFLVELKSKYATKNN